MAKKINLGIVFGGKSVEHEVSLQSALNAIDALDRNKYHLFLIGIDKQGKWALYDESNYLLHPYNPEEIALNSTGKPFDLLQILDSLDVAFPILHGSFGEDGTIQGLFKLFDVPFVGADVLGSAIGMDKDVMKRLLHERKIPIAPFLILHRDAEWSVEHILDTLSFPLFVKPNNGGSSIGIDKVKEAVELKKAINAAFQFDHKVVVEESIEGREIQISILGNEDPIASLACEIIPKGEFHSYASKYIDPDGAEFIYPADLEMGIFLKARAIALKVYKILCCEGMGRVDLFLKPCGEILVNEINTIPGLTNMSPFAKMWQVSGMEYAEMLDHLIQFALKRHAKDKERMTEINLKNQWITQ